MVSDASNCPCYRTLTRDSIRGHYRDIISKCDTLVAGMGMLGDGGDGGDVDDLITEAEDECIHLYSKFSLKKHGNLEIFFSRREA